MVKCVLSWPFPEGNHHEKMDCKEEGASEWWNETQVSLECSQTRETSNVRKFSEQNAAAGDEPGSHCQPELIEVWLPQVGDITGKCWRGLLCNFMFKNYMSSSWSGSVGHGLKGPKFHSCQGNMPRLRLIPLGGMQEAVIIWECINSQIL